MSRLVDLPPRQSPAVRDVRSRFQRNLDAWTAARLDPHARMFLVVVALIASVVAAVVTVIGGDVALRVQPLAVLLVVSAVWVITVSESLGRTARLVARLTWPDRLRGVIVIMIWTVLLTWPLGLLAVLLIGQQA
jgi:hypothetical protein